MILTRNYYYICNLKLTKSVEFTHITNITTNKTNAYEKNYSFCNVARRHIGRTC